MATLRNGTYWLERLQGALIPVAKFMALRKYGSVPDVEDRISDAYTALADAAARFAPKPGMDGLGYFLHYVLASTAGGLRNGASQAGRWANEAASFVDMGELGIDRIYETVPGSDDEEPEENLWVLNNGAVASTTELVGLIADHPKRREIAARKMGLKPDDTGVRIRLLQTLDGIAERELSEPSWMLERPEPAPTVTHELWEAQEITYDAKSLEILEGSELTAEEFRAAVEESATSYTWEDELGDEWANDHSRDRDNGEYDLWPVPTSLWSQVLAAWGELPWADDALVALLTGITDDLAPHDLAVVETMEMLAVSVSGVDDWVVKQVISELVQEIGMRDVEIPEGLSLQGVISSFLAIDTTNLVNEELPRAEALQDRVAGWIDRIASKPGVWASQVAAIKALVLNGASPGEAKLVAQAARAAA